MRRYLPRAILLLLALLLCAGPTPGMSQSPAAQPTPVYYFDLTVSLEWQPGTGDSLPNDLELAGCPKADLAESYLDELNTGLRQTAAYLYSYSEGQMALRNITVYSGGDHWAEADLRVLASDAYRPSAFVGGIVQTPTRNISATAGLVNTIFYPATIFLGRAWDGSGARCGGWSQPAGWRTIGHEWAHYALFLYDEYFNADTNAEQYCTTTGFDLSDALPALGGSADSLMAYQYSADKLWLSGGAPPHVGPPPWSCADTPQDRVHGETDWETVKRFYSNIKIPARLTPDIQFEGSLAAGAFNVSFVPPAVPLADTSAEVRLAALATPRQVGQAYLIHPGANGVPQRIIGQGEIIPGEAAALPFWGVQSAKDRALVVIPNWVTGAWSGFPERYDTAPTLDTVTPNLLTAKTDQWRPSLTITPIISQRGQFSDVTGLAVRFQDCLNKAKRIMLVYCPAGGDCGTPALVSNGDTHTFVFPFDGNSETPAIHGYIYARNLESQPLAETAAWYQLAGGVGPATGNGHAPLAEGGVETNPTPGQPLPIADTRLLYSPAQGCTATSYILPAGILGIVGAPVDVQPVIANGQGVLQPWGRDDAPLQVRLSYSQDLLDRLGIGEEQLVVLRLDPSKRFWTPLPAVDRSRALDWIAVAAQPFAGQGAVYALGYAPARAWLPLIRR